MHKFSAWQSLKANSNPVQLEQEETCEAPLPPSKEGSGEKLLPNGPNTQDKNSNTGCKKLQSTLSYCLLWIRRGLRMTCLVDNPG